MIIWISILGVNCRRRWHNTNGVIGKINIIRPVDCLHDAAVDPVHKPAPGVGQKAQRQFDATGSCAGANHGCRIAYPDGKILIALLGRMVRPPVQPLPASPLGPMGVT